MMLVNLSGALLIVFIVWWFWIYKPKAKQVQANRQLEIIVENGVYVPDRIEVSKGSPLVLSFIRKDPSPCAEKVIFTGLDVRRDLALDKPNVVELQVDKEGEYEFTCQMGMYRGRLIVK